MVAASASSGMKQYKQCDARTSLIANIHGVRTLIASAGRHNPQGVAG